MLKNIFPTFLFLFFIQVILMGQIDTTQLIETIHITQNRLSTPINKEARNVIIIDKKEIESTPAQSIQELLQYHGAVDLKRRGIHGVQSDIGIRGSSYNHVLILIDGVRMSDPQTGHHNMNLPISLQDVERIEIIKGAAARIYGQNALAGAINIIYKKYSEKPLSVNVSLGYGTFNTLESGISISQHSKSFDHTASIYRATSDGYKYNTDYRLYNINYKASANIYKTHSIELISGYSTRKFGANGFYASEKFVDQYEETKTGFIALSSKLLFDNFVLKPRLSWRNNNDNYYFLRQDPDYYHNEHTSNTYTAELHGKYESQIGSTGIGVDYSKETLLSNNLGNRDRGILGIFLEHQFSWLNDDLNITIGGYGNQITHQKFSVNPGIDISYAVNNNINTFASWNKGTRLPTYTNLYYNSRAEQGNEQLKSEKSSSVELGINYHSRSLRSTLSYFNRNNSNLIDWAKDSTTQEKWHALNFNQVIMQGIDFNNQIDIRKILTTTIPILINIDYTYIHSEVIDNKIIAISRYALNNLRQQLILGTNIPLWKNKFSLNTQLRYLDRVSLDNYSLVDIGLQLQLKRVNIYATINNLLNKKYKETNLVTMPGRYFNLGIRYKSQ